MRAFFINNYFGFLIENYFEASYALNNHKIISKKSSRKFRKKKIF